MEENSTAQNISSNINTPVAPVSPSSEIQTPSSGKSKFSKILISVIILIFLLAGSAAGFYALKPQIMKLVSKPVPAPTVAVQTFPTSPPAGGATENLEFSKGMGYPIIGVSPYLVDKDKLKIFSFSQKKLLDTNIEVLNGSGGVALGSNDPIASPNLMHTAFVDAETSNLWILTNESLERHKITSISKGEQILIGGWSPDSKNLVYLIYQGNFADGSENTNGPDLGYYIYNTETDISKKIPITAFYSFVGNRKILTGYVINNFSSFDLDTFQTTNILKTQNDLGTISITQDGKFWAFDESFNNASNKLVTRIIYAPFPKLEGETVIEGVFGSVQQPMISPQGTRLAFLKGDTANSLIWVYDSINKTQKRFLAGRIKQWVDENTLIFQSPVGNYYLLNIQSGQSMKMN